MSDITDQNLASKKQLTLITYILYAVGVVVAPATLIALIINLIKKDEMKGTWLESHFRYQIRTALFALLIAIIGVILSAVFVGFFILLGGGIWYIFRIVKGFLRFNDNKPMYENASIQTTIA